MEAHGDMRAQVGDGGAENVICSDWASDMARTQGGAAETEQGVRPGQGASECEWRRMMMGFQLGIRSGLIADRERGVGGKRKGKTLGSRGDTVIALSEHEG